MNTLKTYLWSACLLSIIAIPAHGDAYNSGHSKDAINVFQLVQWKGVGVPVSLPKGVGADVVAEGSPCYTVPMVQPQTGIEIGTGYDCITNPGSLVELGAGTVTTYYIFAFRGRGSLVSENRVVVRMADDTDSMNPIPTDSVSANDDMTHILGSFPTNNTIAGGTGFYRKAKGQVRVSGAVSLAHFPDEIVFDDLFVINYK